MSANVYDFESISPKLKEILEREKTAFRMEEEQFRVFIMFLSQVCRSYLKTVEKEVSKAITSDLDEYILKVIEDEKLLDKYKEAIPVQFFIQYNFHEVLDVEPNYYRLRAEVLAHSKKLKEHPKSVDYLIWRTEDEAKEKEN